MTKYFRNDKFEVDGNRYQEFQSLQGGCCTNFKGYASKFYFYKETYQDPVEENPWYFGKISRQESKV